MKVGTFCTRFLYVYDFRFKKFRAARAICQCHDRNGIFVTMRLSEPYSRKPVCLQSLKTTRREAAIFFGVFFRAEGAKNFGTFTLDQYVKK